MVSCKELYEQWKRKGNFCHKSENTAKDIERYIEYREKYRLESYEINRCALLPLMNIEKFEHVHRLSLQELKKKCRKIGGRRITRRLMIEIITTINDKVPIHVRITHIPQIRTRISGFQHEISEISFEVRDGFDKLKIDTGIKNNNMIMAALVNFASRHKAELIDINKMMEDAAKVEKPDETQILDGILDSSSIEIIKPKN